MAMQLECMGNMILNTLKQKTGGDTYDEENTILRTRVISVWREAEIPVPEAGEIVIKNEVTLNLRVQT